MSQEFGAPLEEPKKKNNTTLIVIIVVVVLLICCCCSAIGWLGWTYGDLVLQQLNF